MVERCWDEAAGNELSMSAEEKITEEKLGYFCVWGVLCRANQWLRVRRKRGNNGTFTTVKGKK